MYEVRVYNDGYYTRIHSEENKLTSGKVTKGINTIDSFQFAMLPSNDGFNEIHDYTTLVTVYNTNKRRYDFYGRVLYSEDTMDESGAIRKDVICESYLGFLCDSQQGYVAERNWTVRELLEYIVNTHNSQVEEYKRFTIGEVTVTDPNDNLYCGIQWANTWETINDKLLDSLGGEIRFRVEDEVIYLDYLVEIGKESTTEIALSRNMKSISREKDPSEVITRLIPLGGKKEGSEERLDITSVNNGKNYIEDATAIALYGIRVARVEFDDITIASNLLKRGLEWLAENNRIRISYTATALDLSLIGLDVDDFDVYNYHPVKNRLLRINDTVRIIKKSIDVCEEVKSTIEFGDNIVRLSELMRKQANRIKWINSRYATNERLTNEIDGTKNLIGNTKQEIENKFNDYAPKNEVHGVVNEYINSDEGIAKIKTALSGTYVGKNELTGYVKTTELNTTVEQYLNTEEGKASIKSAVDGEFITEDKLSGYVEKATLSTEIGQYISGEEGKAKIITAAEGTYQRKDAMSGYVTTTTLNTSVNQYLNSTEGKAQIKSAVSGTFVTEDKLSGYVKTSNLNTSISQYLEGTTGKAQIKSAVSGEFITESDLTGYVKTATLDTSIGQYIDSTTGKAKIETVVSAKYQTKSGMSDYAKASAISTIEQSVSSVKSEITLSTTYSNNTIGTNVQALLQLVSNPNSSSIMIKADKINFSGFTTFLRASDLGEYGSTSIDGGRITTGKISADRIEAGSVKADKVYGSGSYSSTVMLSSNLKNLYVGGTTTTTSASEVIITASSSIKINTTATIGVTFVGTGNVFRPIAAGTALGASGYAWGNTYIGKSGSYYWDISGANIKPSSSYASNTYFMIGTSSYPINALYTKELYINGAKVSAGSGSSSSSSDFKGKAVTMGGNSSYYIQATTSRQLCPNTSLTSYPFYLGTSSYYWHYAYIGSVQTIIGSSYSSKLGFFGSTGATRQTVSSSASVATLITALKAYGLIY